MNNKRFYTVELVGLILSLGLWAILWWAYSLSDKNVVVALVSRVNNSIWENVKPLVIVYLLFALIELSVTYSCYKIFAVGKFLGVYAMLICFISVSALTIDSSSFLLKLLTALLSLTVGFGVSYYTVKKQAPVTFYFPTVCFMLFLLFIMIISFTVFPPQGKLFQDADTGLYGIIPEYIDVGATVLDEIYRIQ